jgi:hypothetical protein
MENKEWGKIKKEREQKINKFAKELKKLMNKHKITFAENEQYDGHENYCGSDLYFAVDGEIYWSKMVAEILNELYE